MVAWDPSLGLHRGGDQRGHGWSCRCPRPAIGTRVLRSARVLTVSVRCPHRTAQPRARHPAGCSRGAHRAVAAIVTATASGWILVDSRNLRMIWTEGAGRRPLWGGSQSRARRLDPCGSPSGRSVSCEIPVCGTPGLCPNRRPCIPALQGRQCGKEACACGRLTRRVSRPL